jgi:hypothetical protein
MTDTIDSKITLLFEDLRKKKAEVEADEKEIKKSWITNCSIQTEFSQMPVNITTTTEDRIKRTVHFLLQHRDYTHKAEELLGLPKSTKYEGYTYDEWISDCKKRLVKINLAAKKDQLDKLEKRLDAIVSPEQRRQMELDAITKELAG